MRKRGRIVLAAVVIAALGGLAWWELAAQHGPPDPVYDGHPISWWVDPPPRPMSALPTAGGLSAPALLGAIRPRFPSQYTLDSNAVPYLVQVLKTRDVTAGKTYMRLYPFLPAWLRSRLPLPMHRMSAVARACVLLGRLGPDARPAIPNLIQVLQDGNAGVARMNAAWALGIIANGDDKTVVKALVAAAKEKGREVSENAGGALVRIDPEAADGAGVTMTGDWLYFGTAP